MKTITIFRNHYTKPDSKFVYTFAEPRRDAVNSDELTVELPTGWDVFRNLTDEIFFISPWKTFFWPDNVLGGDKEPLLIVRPSIGAGQYSLKVIAARSLSAENGCRQKPTCAIIPVITTYNFDHSAIVRLFETDEEACAYLKDSYEKELYIDREENGYDTEGNIDEDCDYARIVNHFADHDDITEFRIGDLYFPGEAHDRNGRNR